MTATDTRSLRSPGRGGPGTCAGCGSSLPQRGSGRPRKWCSERCRKGQYAGECVDCGAPTDGSDGPGKASERCASCRVEFEKTDLDLATRGAARLLGRNRWTDEQILDAIRRTATNGVASVNAYNAVRATGPAAFPSEAIIIRRFGRWTLAVEAAGLHPGRDSGGHAKRAPDGVLLAAIRDCATHVGRRPTYSEYEAWAVHRFVPSATTVRVRLGGWIAACERALNGTSPATEGSP